MEIEPICQLNLGEINSRRFGDILSDLLDDPEYSEFHFAVAYMRTSGIRRLMDDIIDFKESGGHVAGAVGVGGRIHGVDKGVTSVEALHSLLDIAPDSTVFSTVTDVSFHPKIYLFKSDSSGVAVIGSANLTKDGLFRNVELGSAIYFDLSTSHDRDVFEQYEVFVDTLLNTSNENIQPLDEDIISTLEENKVIPSESDSSSTGSETTNGTDTGDSGTQTTLPDETEDLFPPLDLDTVPSPSSPSPIEDTAASTDGTVSPDGSVFVKVLTDSECSNQSGTPFFLIPKDAIHFFPNMTEEGSYDPKDVFFIVRLNTPDGLVEHKYRFWYYEGKEEYRLRVNDETIDLTTEGGGDLITVEELEDRESPEFEVTIIKQDNDDFDKILAACDHKSGDSRWGIMDKLP